MPRTKAALALDDQLCFALYAASRAMTARYRPQLDALGLTYPQFLVMVVLWDEGPATVNGLGERLRLDSGTLSPLLKRLEANGLINRTRSAEDERSVIVEATARGRRLRDRAAGVADDIRASLDGMDLESLRDHLRNLEDALRR
jgi:MarR family transcriptional regulator, organic hydroperoxide resistance regulator